MGRVRRVDVGGMVYHGWNRGWRIHRSPMYVPVGWGRRHEWQCLRQPPSPEGANYLSRGQQPGSGVSTF